MISQLLQRKKKSPNKSHNVSFVDEMVCMFCSGEQCKQCGPKAYLHLADRPAIDRLHSSWITENIIAMQRPTSAVFQDTVAGIVPQFQAYKVSAIFNLTEAGEHPFCGCGILECSGFSYNPELFMAVGIKHFNYAWKDMTVPTMGLMMDLVHVAINEIWYHGKIAVHCHAGFGRTGTAIACILIALEGLSGEEAIDLVRARREGSIQTEFQIHFIFEFEKCYKETIMAFPNLTKTSSNKKSFRKSVSDQFYTLSFDEMPVYSLKLTSKAIAYSVQALRKSVKNDEFCSSVTGLALCSDTQDYTYDKLLLDFDELIVRILKDINMNNWTLYYSLLAVVAGEHRNPYEIGIMDNHRSDKTLVKSNIEKIAAFIMSQVVLVWLESRGDYLFDDNLVSMLELVWTASENGILYTILPEEVPKMSTDCLKCLLSTKNVGKNEKCLTLTDDRTDLSLEVNGSRDYTRLNSVDSSVPLPTKYAPSQSKTRANTDLEVYKEANDYLANSFENVEHQPDPLEAPALNENKSDTRNPEDFNESMSSKKKREVILKAVIAKCLNELSSKVKISHIKHIVSFIQLLQESSRKNESAFIDNLNDTYTLNTENPISLHDLAVFRISIASINGSSKCPSLLNNQCLSLSTVSCLQQIYKASGFYLSKPTLTANADDELRQKVILKTLVIAKTFQFLNKTTEPIKKIPALQKIISNRMLLRANSLSKNSVDSPETQNPSENQ